VFQTVYFLKFLSMSVYLFWKLNFDIWKWNCKASHWIIIDNLYSAEKQNQVVYDNPMRSLAISSIMETKWKLSTFFPSFVICDQPPPCPRTSSFPQSILLACIFSSQSTTKWSSTRQVQALKTLSCTRISKIVRNMKT
jgi:hypothetical protein